MTSGREDDDLWRSIVDNYGDRAELDEPEPESPAEPLLPAEPPAAYDDEEEGYEPPEPPPLPRLAPPLMAGWAGVLGAPALLVICLLAGVGLAQWFSLLLVAAFIGGFLYLVLQMPREPRDPWDDGSRI